MLVTISGKSASGKSDIADALVKNGYKKVITSTTRAPREGEINDIDYHFLSNDEFLKKLSNNQFLEHEVYSGGRLYGTEMKDIKKAIYDKENDYVIVLTPGGVRALCREFGEDSFSSIYIDVKDAIRVKRYIDRIGEDKMTLSELSECFERIQRDLGMFQGFDREVDFIYSNDMTVPFGKQNPLVPKILADLYIEKCSRFPEEEKEEEDNILEDFT